MKRILIVWFLCAWTVLPSWAQTYKYEEIYQKLPFTMPKVEAPQFPSLKVFLPDFGAVGNGVELCTDTLKPKIVITADILLQFHGIKFTCSEVALQTTPFDGQT